MENKELPQVCKIANIITIHEASNYRPISLTSMICKVLEKNNSKIRLWITKKQIMKIASTWVQERVIMSDTINRGYGKMVRRTRRL